MSKLDINKLALYTKKYFYIKSIKLDATALKQKIVYNFFVHPRMLKFFFNQILYKKKFPFYTKLRYAGSKFRISNFLKKIIKSRSKIGKRLIKFKCHKNKRLLKVKKYKVKQSKFHKAKRVLKSKKPKAKQLKFHKAKQGRHLKLKNIKKVIKAKKQTKSKYKLKRFLIYKKVIKSFSFLTFSHPFLTVKILQFISIILAHKKDSPKFFESSGLILFNQQIIRFLKKTFKILNNREKLTKKSERIVQRKFLIFIFRIRKHISRTNLFEVYKKLLNTFIRVNTGLSGFNTKFCKYKLPYSLTLIKLKKVRRSPPILVYDKLLGLILKNGKKSLAKKIIDTAFNLARRKLKMISIKKIIRKIFKRLKSSVEVKKVRVRRNFHLVPFPVNVKRKFYLVIKWILLSLKKLKKKKKSTFFKLYNEVINIFKTKYSFSSKRKRANLQSAIKNMANAHYRW